MGRRVRQVTKARTGAGTVDEVLTTTQDLRFMYDGWHMIAQIKAVTTTSGTTFTPQKVYVWGLDISGTRGGAGGIGGLLAWYDRTEGQMYAPCYDGRGNVQAIYGMNDSHVISEYEYDQYGKNIRTTGYVKDATTAVWGMVAYDPISNPFRYQTKWRLQDSTGINNSTGYSQFDLYDYGKRWYNPKHGRFINRDPIGEQGGLNLYAFVGNDPVNQSDMLGEVSIEDVEPFVNTAIESEIASGFGRSLHQNDYHQQSSEPALGNNLMPYVEGDPFVVDTLRECAGICSYSDYNNHESLASSSLNKSGTYNDGETNMWNANQTASMVVGAAGAVMDTTEIAATATKLPSLKKIVKSSLFSKVGVGAFILGVGLDKISYSSGDMSLEHLTANTVMGIVGVRGGPYGAMASLGYFAIDQSSPRGWAGLGASIEQTGYQSYNSSPSVPPEVRTITGSVPTINDFVNIAIVLSRGR